MSGYYTIGFSQITVPTGMEQIPCDTQAAQGINPETGWLNISQLGGGATVSIVDAGNSGTVAQSAVGVKVLNWPIAGTSEVFTLTGGVSGQAVDLYLTQTGASKTVGTWTNVIWAGGTAPTLTTTSGHTDLVTLRWNSGLTKWTGSSILDIR